MKLFKHTIHIHKKRLAVFLIISILIVAIVSFKHEIKIETSTARFWDIQAIDTMKYSRDVSREKLNDPTFDVEINRQVKDIAQTGATHVAIATPYDEEFLPILKRWVKAARQNEIKVWFRGNFSGWEKWFEYEPITRDQHIKMTRTFITSHPELFEDGDIFSACPECENGGPGDPRLNGDAEGHKKFLIDSYKASKQAFEDIGKDVPSNFMSMNGDVAKLIMDRETTASLDGLVTIDHYTGTPEQLLKDVNEYAKNSGGQVFIGEFGVPIPDINGEMTESQQAKWITDVGRLLSTSPHVAGLSYWVNKGGSTAIFTDAGKPKRAAAALKGIYMPEFERIKVINEAGEAISDALIDNGITTAVSNTSGLTSFPYINKNQKITISATNYRTKEMSLNKTPMHFAVVLKKTEESFIFRLKKIFRQGLNMINSPIPLN